MLEIILIILSLDEDPFTDIVITIHRIIRYSKYNNYSGYWLNIYIRLIFEILQKKYYYINIIVINIKILIY